MVYGTGYPTRYRVQFIERRCGAIKAYFLYFKSSPDVKYPRYPVQYMIM